MINIVKTVTCIKGKNGNSYGFNEGQLCKFTQKKKKKKSELSLSMAQYLYGYQTTYTP